MSEVALTIGGRIYRVACAPGEEEHISALGAMINDKLASMGNLSGHEAQNLLFAALLLADEVHEGRDTVGRSDHDIAAAQALAQTATGELEEIKAALGNRDSEFEALQTAHHDAMQECAAAQARLAELDEKLAESHSHAAALQAQVDDLASQRDELAARPDPQPASKGDEANLAPALERLAEMLEQTADKLESSLPTT